MRGRRVAAWVVGSAVVIGVVGCPTPAVSTPYDPGLRASNRQFPSAAQAPAMAVPGNLLLNPSFEMNGGAGSAVFTDWRLFNNDESPGSFFVQTGTMAPLPSGSLATVPPPPDGRFAAMSDQTGPGLRIIYQDVTLPPGNFRLSCDVFINSEADFAVPDPETLDPAVQPNQQARIDILNPAAPIDDVGAGVLQNIFFTMPGDPGDPTNPMTAYISVSSDITGGGTIRLRFAEVDNQLFFNFGIDACVLVSTGEVGAPALDRNALAVLALALLGFGGLTFWRRRMTRLTPPRIGGPQPGGCAGRARRVKMKGSANSNCVTSIVAVVLVGLLTPAASAAATKCTMRFTLSGWSAFYETAHGSGTITCNNRRSAAVSIRTTGGGLTFGKSKIVNGKGTFSEVGSMSELFGSYATADVHAGIVASSDAQVLTKGTVSLALAGTGQGVDIGFDFGKFTIKQAKRK